MFRYAIACLLLAVAISAAPLPQDDIFDQLTADNFDLANLTSSLPSGLLPSEFFTFFKSLTDEDRAILKEGRILYAQGKMQKEETMDSSKEKNGSVYEEFRAKVDALSPETKTFAKDVIIVLDLPHPLEISSEKFLEQARAIVTKYEALSDKAKAEIQEKLPKLAKLIRAVKLYVNAITFLVPPVGVIYKTLSAETKVHLQAEFPLIVKLIQSKYLAFYPLIQTPVLDQLVQKSVQGHSSKIL
uniref:Fatty-acid and retinol-binding protein 1 n=1 Tax=Steinernema glaseri TaxID=37863 RepID=A0A1I8ALJ1_9BILA